MVNSGARLLSENGARKEEDGYNKKCSNHKEKRISYSTRLCQLCATICKLLILILYYIHGDKSQIGGVMVMIALLVLLGITALIFLWGMGIYNGLVTSRNGFKNSFAQIDTQLKRRYDLIPNLVESAKAYIKHEKETLDAVITARAKAVTAQQAVSQDPANAQAVRDLGQAETQLTGSLGRLLAVAENYPDLKANTTISQLMEELTSTENKVSFARQAFNDSVMNYNNMREKFPNNFVATTFNFEAAQLLEITNAAEREAPKVNFG